MMQFVSIMWLIIGGVGCFFDAPIELVCSAIIISSIWLAADNVVRSINKIDKV